MVVVCQSFVAADYCQDSDLAGVDNGATLSALTNPSAPLSVDSAVLNLGDKVLLVGQSNQNENGYYELTMQGNSVDQQWVLTRVDPGLCLSNCMTYFIKSGVELSCSLWMMEGGDDPITPGATDLVFTRKSVTPASGPCGNIVQLTDSTSGTPSNTVEQITGSGADSTINNNFADLVDKVNDILQCLQDLGLMSGP